MIRGLLPHRVVLKTHVRSMIAGNEIGGSCPELFNSDDGRSWFVKAQNNPQGLRVLVNELLGTSFSATLGGAVSQCAVCMLPDQLASSLRFNGTGQSWQQGASFGSEYVESADLVPSMLAQITNSDDLAPVVAVDTMFGAFDHRQARGVPMTTGGFRAIAVDFGYALGSPNWTASGLRNRVVPLQLHDPNGWLAYVTTESMVSTSERLRDMNAITCDEIMNSVPSDWNAAPEELESVKGLVLSLKEPVATLLEEAANKKRRVA